MPGDSDNGRREAAIQRAMQLVTEALDLLDAHRGPADATAHLDLALQRLREATNGGR